MSVKPRFSLTKRIREIKFSVFGDESCDPCELGNGDDYDPNFAHFYEQIKQNARTSRNSRTRNMFNVGDLNVSFNSLESDESTEEDGTKLVLSENPLSPSRTEILVNIDDEFSGDQCASSNSEVLSGEELAITEIDDEPVRKTRKRQSEIEKAPSVSQTLVETAETVEHTKVFASRKSRRTRIKPCDYWRLERPKYVRDSTGLAWVINGVEEGSKETVKIESKNKARKRLRKTAAEVKKEHEYSIHATKRDLASNESRKKQLCKSNLLIDKASLAWKASGSSGNDVKMALIQKDMSKEEAWGLLKIAGLAKKLPQETGDYTTYFTILQGNLCVEIGNNSSVILDNSSIFEIPPNTVYSLENVRRDESLLQFIVKKRTESLPVS